MFSFKELEEVTIKALFDMQIGNRKIEKGEIIAAFDSVQIANLQEFTSYVSANGGFNNTARVFWNTTNKITLNFLKGVFSKEQFALMTNSRMLAQDEKENVEITWRDAVETDENCKATLQHTPVKNLFVYDRETGEKIKDYEIEDNVLTLTEPFKEVYVSYIYNYINKNQTYIFGQNCLSGFVELEGRTRIKDDITGIVTTGIFKVPRLRLLSNLSIRLGEQASPVVGNFSAECIPTGPRGDMRVVEFTILDNDIDSDI